MSNCTLTRDYLLSLDLAPEMNEFPEELFYQELFTELTHNDIHHRIVLRFSKDEDIVHIIFASLVKYDMDNANKQFKVYELLSEMNRDCFFSKFEIDLEDNYVQLNMVYHTTPDSFNPESLFEIIIQGIRDIESWYPALMKLKWG